MAKSESSDAFIGGAERARRQARKQMNRPPPRSSKPNKRHRCNTSKMPPYPKSMRPHDRFFGSLLSASVDDFKESQVDDRKHDDFMPRCCSLLNVPSLPAVPVKTSFHRSMEQKGDARSHHLLQRTSSFLSETSFVSTGSSSSGTYDSARSYYMSKAPLILEESRYIIADALNRQSYQKRSGCVLSLQLHSVDEKYPFTIQQRQFAPLLLNFVIKKIKDSEKGVSWSRPGNVFVLKHLDSQSAVLACVAPMVKNKSKEAASSQNSSITLMIFRQDDLDVSHYLSNDESITTTIAGDNLFQAVALTTLISQVRQMEACLRMTKVSFMPKLLGSVKSTHIRFNDYGDEEEVIIEKKSSETESVNYESEISSNESDNDSIETLRRLMAKLPQLNLTQEKAASVFLSSLPASLMLVQGPPGTGKSTFLVNVICRRLITDLNARILVTAPTNKAVTVLAQRFLDAINVADDSTFDDVNPLLVGVEDKLVSEGEQCFSTDEMAVSLRSIFVYTWLESIKTEWSNLLTDIEDMLKGNSQPASASVEVLIKRVRKMEVKLVNGIPHTSSVCGHDMKMILQNLCAAAAAIQWESSIEEYSDEHDSSLHFMNESICHGNNLLGLLREIDSCDIVPELLSSARVIFCTLSTAGSSVLKQTSQIDDLLVDEAAAATEAEICIPFHLRPKRMLAVGDPMQLPPTIMSRRASDLGLSKSMHDRLMNECGEDFIMLDEQYRMVPSISHFPCRQFYDGKITDGFNVTCTAYSSQTTLSMNKPYSFIHVDGKEFKSRCGSYANNEECEKIVQVLEEMQAKSNKSDWDSHDRLRIITFYQAQTSLLKSLLAKRKFNKVLVSTVDSSQGCEADTVIISFTRSNSKKGVLQAAGFLADDRRINVAITRGRHQLICVGNANTLGLEGSEVLKKLVHDAKQRKCIICSNQ